MRKADPEKNRQYSARYYAAHREKVKARAAKYRTANLEKRKAYAAGYRAANPEKVRAWQAKYYAASREKRKEYYAANREKLRRSQMFRRYGLSPEAYGQLLAMQGGKCAICQKPFTTTPHIDHDHATRAVRGLLCSPCNTSLGSFEDDPALLQSAIDYLEAAGTELI